MLHKRGSSGPEGQMELGKEHRESGSGHVDVYETITLEARGDAVVLVVETREKNASNGSDSTRTENYLIDPAELAELIRKHGKSVRPVYN